MIQEQQELILPADRMSQTGDRLSVSSFCSIVSVEVGSEPLKLPYSRFEGEKVSGKRGISFDRGVVRGESSRQNSKTHLQYFVCSKEKEKESRALSVCLSLLLSYQREFSVTESKRGK